MDANDNLNREYKKLKRWLNLMCGTIVFMLTLTVIVYILYEMIQGLDEQ